MKRRFECADETDRFLVVEYDTETHAVNVIHKLEIADDSSIEEILDTLGWVVLKEEKFEKPTITKLHRKG